MKRFLRRMIASPSRREGARHEGEDDRIRAAALGAALAKINHDLRNTLSTAMLAADRLEKSDDPVVRRILPRLLETIERATDIASAALNFAGQETPKLSPTRFALHALAAEIGDALDGGARWSNQVPRDVEIEADRARLGEALLHIARNAVQSGAREVRISLQQEGGRVRILIADDGPGLAPRARDNLFTPFLGAGRADKTGLGLVLARDVVRAHGGEIRLEATGDDGTTFVVELPDKVPAGARLRI